MDSIKKNNKGGSVSIGRHLDCNTWSFLQVNAGSRLPGRAGVVYQTRQATYA